VSGSLSALRIADPPERWARLGFTVRDGKVVIGGVTLALGAGGTGITGWSLPEIDGLRSFAFAASAQPADPHPNGASGLDHVVVVTPDFDRTSSALAAADLPLKRLRDAGGFRQGFRRVGPAILELVEAVDEDPGGPARFWGLVVIVADLDALAARLGEHLGRVHAAVQRGRRIATLRAGAGLSTKLAFMDPEPS